MRGLLLGITFVASSAFASDAGTIKQPETTSLVDAGGESWWLVSPSMPASFVLTGPARFQVGVRVNIPADLAAGAAGIISVRTGGKPLAQFRLQPKAGPDTWKDQTAFKPSPAVGFLVDVAAGDQVYEFRLNGGGDFGGAVRVIDASQSKRPLPATAPVVKIPAPPATAVAVAAATPTPKPVATATPSRVVSGKSMWQVSFGVGSIIEAEGTAPNHQWSAIGDVRFHPRDYVFVAAGGEWRAGTQRVPVPGAPADGAYENRQSADGSAGLRLDAGGLELLAGPWARFAEYDSTFAPRRFLLAGVHARVGMNVGAFEVHGAGDVGVPVMDETPPNYQTGDLVSGGGWSAGLSMRMKGNVRLGLEYQGEVISRYASERISNGAFANAIVEF